MIRKHAQAGYTLTELLVVLLLLGLLTGIGPIAVKKLVPNVALNSATQTLQADLELLRNRSLLNAQRGELRIESNGGGYFLIVADKTLKSRRIGNGVVLLEGNINNENSSEDRGILVAGLDGRFSGSDIVLTRGSRTRTITINPVFGTSQIAGRAQ